MESKISILKDIYFENRFMCNKLEAILFEEMRRIGLLREIVKYGKFALNIFKMFTEFNCCFNFLRNKKHELYRVYKKKLNRFEIALSFGKQKKFSRTQIL